MNFLRKYKWWKYARHILVVMMGNAIAAASSACFILPNNLVIGGTTGIGIFVGHFWNENAVSIVALIANIILYVIGVFLLGKKFAMSTLLGTVLYPVFMGLFSMAIGDRILTDDKLLACICGGLFMGIGIGIVVREGASTGGTDIPPLILNKYFGLPVSVGVWIVDLTIVFMQAFTMSIETALYGLFTVLMYSFVIDAVSPIGRKKTQVKIISAKYPEVRDMLINELNLGVTILYGQTGYLKERCHMMLTVVSKRNLVRLKNEVYKIDPEAFLTVSVITEVRGRGFSTERIYLPKNAASADQAQKEEETDFNQSETEL